jgi:hypothetical protein
MTAFRDAYLAGYRAGVHDSENVVQMLEQARESLRERDVPLTRDGDFILLSAKTLIHALANDPDVPEEKP